jgi:hypothetical protein
MHGESFDHGMAFVLCVGVVVALGIACIDMPYGVIKHFSNVYARETYDDANDVWVSIR